MFKSTNKYIDALTYTLIIASVFCVVFMFQTGETVKHHVQLIQIGLESYKNKDMGVVFTVMLLNTLSILSIVFAVLAYKELRKPTQKNNRKV